MQLRDTIERNKIEQTANHETQQAEIQHQIGLNRIKDAYQDERFIKQLELDNEKFKTDLEQRRQSHQQDVVEQMDNVNILDSLLDLEEKKRKADHMRQMEVLNTQNSHQLEHERLKYTHEETELSIKSGMSAEQLSAEQLSKLDPEAQAAYFNNRDKEAAALARAEAEREKAEFVDRKSSEMTQLMADLAKQALNAAGGVAANDRQRAEDYKADLHREQDRYDRHQEQVTKYMLGGNKTDNSQSRPASNQPISPFISTPQQPLSEQNAGRIVKCPKCGKENNLDEGSFCAYCREPLQ